MRTLYLLRHAKSARDDPALEDFDRPLNERGRDAATRMGAFMAREGLVPATVVCSAARRAVETWARVAPALRHPGSAHRARSLHGLERRHPRIRPGAAARSGVAMLIGHNPGIEDTALRLAGAGDPRLIERMEAKFSTGRAGEVRQAQGRATS